jgi:hypothetical protein
MFSNHKWNPTTLTSTAAKLFFKYVFPDTRKLISKCTAYCQTLCVLNLCAKPSCLAPHISNNSIHSYATPANLEIRLQHKNPISHAFKLSIPIRNKLTTPLPFNNAKTDNHKITINKAMVPDLHSVLSDTASLVNPSGNRLQKHNSSNTTTLHLKVRQHFQKADNIQKYQSMSSLKCDRIKPSLDKSTITALVTCPWIMTTYGLGRWW